MCYAQNWLQVFLAIVAVTVAATVAHGADSRTITVLSVDHASICGLDLQAMQQAFSDAGLKPDYGGPHTNGGTHMALLGFDDGSYLEFIARQTPGSADGSPWENCWRPMLGRARGPFPVTMYRRNLQG